MGAELSSRPGPGSLGPEHQPYRYAQGLRRRPLRPAKCTKQRQRFSIGAEYGRILNRNICLGISGRHLWYGTSSDHGTAFDVHPYVRITTSFHRFIPNLFADIGYDFRRRAYDDSSMAPTYSHDFGIRPGIMVDVAGWFYLFIQFSFTGYQWSRSGDEISSSWTFFRHDYQDRCAGVFFYF